MSVASKGSKRRPALGRGLGALIPAVPAPAERSGDDEDGSSAGARRADGGGTGVKTVPIEHLLPSPDQPRKYFDEAALAGLADSIAAQGIIQPIVVTPAPPQGGTPRYRIVAGERRWRAAQRAGMHDVPVVVRKTEDAERLELALVENIQRADLNPIEEARAYSALIDLRGYTQEAVADRVGKDRSTISNALRLLRLPDEVQGMVREGKLSMGHARALLGLGHEAQMRALAREAVRGSLSVRATERAVRKRVSEQAPPKPPDDQARRKIIVRELETRLQRRLGVRVRLRPKGGQKGAGTLEIPYQSLDELDRLLHLILDDGADERYT